MEESAGSEGAQAGDGVTTRYRRPPAGMQLEMPAGISGRTFWICRASGLCDSIYAQGCGTKVPGSDPFQRGKQSRIGRCTASNLMTETPKLYLGVHKMCRLSPQRQEVHN